jgi:hypothetical protein
MIAFRVSAFMLDIAVMVLLLGLFGIMPYHLLWGGVMVATGIGWFGLFPWLVKKKGYAKWLMD